MDASGDVLGMHMEKVNRLNELLEVDSFQDQMAVLLQQSMVELGATDLTELSVLEGPAVEILADVGYQALGARIGGRVVTSPHRKFKKDAPDWYEEVHERRRKAHSSRRIRVEHGIAHL
ncbi:hypothetical protein ACIQRK_37745 [Streptomyces anulatus]